MFNLNCHFKHTFRLEYLEQFLLLYSHLISPTDSKSFLFSSRINTIIPANINPYLLASFQLQPNKLHPYIRTTAAPMTVKSNANRPINPRANGQQQSVINFSNNGSAPASISTANGYLR